jgi:hypothetical protein
MVLWLDNPKKNAKRGQKLKEARVAVNEYNIRINMKWTHNTFTKL